MAPTYKIDVLDVARQGQTVSGAQFGIVQTGFGTAGTFNNAFDYLGGGHVRWPGGTLSEERPDVYSLDIPGLFDGTQSYTPDPTRYRPDLEAMLAFAVQRDIGMSLVIPTAAYATDFAAGQSDLYNLLADLDAGTYGALPKMLELEIGNEFYARAEFAPAPQIYGALAGSFLETVEQFFVDNPTSALSNVVRVGVQVGRTQAEDIAIRNAISPDTLDRIDFLIAHHLPYRFEAIDKKTQAVSTGSGTIMMSRPDLIAAELTAWQDLIRSYNPGAHLSGLHMTEWTIGDASLTSTPNLTFQDLGARQASAILEHFATYTALGIDTADFWGVGIINPNAIVDERGEVNVGGEMFRMLSGALEGKRILNGFQDFDRSDDVSIYSFRDIDTLDVFLAANDLVQNQTSLTLDLSGFGPDAHLTAERLGYTYDQSMPSGTTDPDLRLYEVPNVSGWSQQLGSASYTATLTQDYSVLHLQFQLSDPDQATQYFFGFGSAYLDHGTTANDTKRALIGLNLLDGGPGNDRVLGGIGSDYLRGGPGNDLLSGDPGTSFFGNDVLEPGTGNDLLMGGAGADQFVFRPGDGDNRIARFDLLGSASFRVSGVDFDPALDSLMFLDFGYFSPDDILTHFTVDSRGDVTFSDQGTTIHFHDLGVVSPLNWDIDFL